MVAAAALGQTAPIPDFTAGYEALAKKDYDSAIAHFRAGLSKQPRVPGVHKDLAYTLIKTGENSAARDQFEAALALNGKDEQAGLEYAFLAYETGKPLEARRMFDRLRKSGSPATRAIAGQAFENIDTPLAQGIARWQAALARVDSPETHCELARLAGLRGDTTLAAEQSRLCGSSNPHPAGFSTYRATPSVDAAQTHSASLWAFFDSAYRSRADVDYLAKRWQEGGISVLYIASWHNLEPDSIADPYLAKLIDACHRHAILVYAWLELPYVSEKFWADHSGWREKTALGQDAEIGWRKLMNLQNPECSRAASAAIRALLERFDWDGVNLAELGFESQEAKPDPSLFTPMNDNVRSEFKQIGDFDPTQIFDPASAHTSKKDLQTFLGFRAVLASRMQSEWLKNLEQSRKTKPYLDLVLTQRDDCSNLIISTPAGKKIAVDLNALEESSDELIQSIHHAAEWSFHVALYAEHLIPPADFPAINAAASTAHVSHMDAGKLELDATEQTRINWSGPAAMDGQPWPVRTAHYLIAPAGHHVISREGGEPPFTITGFSVEIQSTTVLRKEVDLAYQSRTRALVTFDEKVASIEVDGVTLWKTSGAQTPGSAILPAGQHLATFTRE